MGAMNPYLLYVDGKKYDWPSPTIPADKLYALVPGLNPSFVLVRDGHGAPDTVVARDERIAISLDVALPPQFYTAPPATFGSGDELLHGGDALLHGGDELHVKLLLGGPPKYGKSNVICEVAQTTRLPVMFFSDDGGRRA